MREAHRFWRQRSRAASSRPRCLETKVRGGLFCVHFPNPGNRLSTEYDAILIVGFGGPERREDVIPFLENVTRGRNIPRERLLAVAEHYYHFGGKSPLNDQVRDLIGSLRPALAERGIKLPIVWEIAIGIRF